MSFNRQVAELQPRRRPARRHARPAHRPHRPAHLRPLRRSDHRARRGRPDGRHGLPAPGPRRILDLTPADGQRLLFSATLDGDVGTLVRQYLTDPVTRSIASATAQVETMEHHVLIVDAAAKPQVVTRDRRPRRAHDPVRAHQARRRPAGEGAAPQRYRRRARCTAARRRTRATGRSPRSRTGRRRCWWPPTWPPAASTSTTSASSCTSTRRPTPRTTCTAPAAPRERATPAPS